MTTAAPPSLESGDRLTRAEFHRRYCARRDIKKAELVEGVVYVGGRVKLAHGAAHAELVALVGSYALRRPTDAIASTSATVILDGSTELQPDVVLLRIGGSAKVNENDYIEGPPELVAEVAASSASYDLHDKKNAYRRAGVREYLVWRVDDQAIDWFLLEDDDYRLVAPDEDGIIESATFPGLRLASAELLAGDPAGALAEIR